MRPGIYTTQDGQVVKVSKTATGWLIRYPDGTVAAVKRETPR